MSDESVETFEVNGFTVNIVQDDTGDDTGDPRDGDNLGIMIANGHRNYILGDEKYKNNITEYAGAAAQLEEFAQAGTVSQFVAWAKAELGASVVLPLWLLDHSGLAMRTAPFAEDSGQWDSGVVGFIFDTPRTREMTGVIPENIEKVLTQEVAVYSMFLEGEVYGYEILDPDGIVVESCWGYLGYREEDSGVRADARSAAEALDKPQWVVVGGSLKSGLRVFGPYDSQANAEENAGEGTAMLLNPPKTI